MLRAAYFGTLLAAAAHGKHTVVLTLIGGGVFGNPRNAIWEATCWALSRVDNLVEGEIHVVVNTRETIAEIDRAEARSRGGWVAEFTDRSVAIVD